MLANLLLLLKPEVAWKQGVAQLPLWALYTRKVPLQNNNFKKKFNVSEHSGKQATTFNTEHSYTSTKMHPALCPTSNGHEWGHIGKTENKACCILLFPHVIFQSSVVPSSEFPEHAAVSHIGQSSADSSFKNSSCKWTFCIYKHLCQSCTTSTSHIYLESGCFYLD